MKITKRQLRRVIREEYSRLKRRGLIREMASGQLRVGSKIGGNHIGPSAADYPGYDTVGELMKGSSVDGTGIYITTKRGSENYYLPEQHGDTPFTLEEIPRVIASLDFGKKSSKKKKFKKKKPKKMKSVDPKIPRRLGMEARLRLGKASADNISDAMEVAMKLGIRNPKVIGHVGEEESNYTIVMDSMGNYYAPLTFVEEESMTLRDLHELIDDAYEEGYID